MSDTRQTHWDKVYSSKAVTDVSWYEAHPAKSLEMIRATGATPADGIIDVGGGASLLVDELLQAGYRDLTVLDISAEVLQKLRTRLGSRGEAVTLIQSDITKFSPSRQYFVWHDRAVFHFLVAPEDRRQYVSALRRAVLPNGHVLISTFGPAGPERCSGLPIVRYDADHHAAELGAGFVLIDADLSIHRTPWSAEQQFLHCRFQYR
jgi:SAM-dependent methyltransferase